MPDVSSQTLPVRARFDWVEAFPPRKGGSRDRWYRFGKRVMDLTIVFASAPLWLPLFTVIYLAIKFENPGAPAFFEQARTGLNGRRFRMLKFRTMVENASEMVASMAALNIRQGTDFKVANDPRVTAVGRLLRRPHLDELPQLWMVIKGEMSLVGPRPTSLPPTAYRMWHTERFDTLPGLTCLWQLDEDAVPAFDDRMRLDILYSQRASIGLDLTILFLTFAYLLRGGRGL